MTAPASPLLSRVADHYHRTFCERKDAQEYLAKRGLTDVDVLKAFRVGYADGSLLKTIPRGGEIKQELLSLGVVTKEGRELLGGCVVVPIPDPLSGEWTTFYGRGMRTPRHCYLTGPLRGVLNYQAARSADELILTESVIDALSFHQVGISTAIPIYGTNGFTADHLDLLKREGVRRVILALDGDAAGRRATAVLKEKLASLGIAVRVMPYPQGVKDPNELLVSCNGNAQAVFVKMLDEAEPRPAAVVVPAKPSTSALPATSRSSVSHDGDSLILRRDGLAYQARAYAPLLGRLRATIKVERGTAFHVDTLDLYASRSRTEFTKRVAKALTVDAEAVERDLLALLVEAEKTASAAEESGAEASGSPPPISESDRAEALAFLRRPDLLDQVAKDVDALGFVGEETNKRLLYLVAISRKLPDPLSAIVLSQSGAGKSGLTEVIEKLTPPEDVVLFTRLTPQSLYYTEPGFLDKKLVIVEERYGSMEADYSIRVLQSRKKLIAAAPIKDPQTGNMRTKVFTVEARAAFIEATTASAVNHENSTRCFELSMDETPEQTRRIHERMSLLQTERGLALRQEADAIARRHWNAQRLLEPLPVVIPFADKLTFPSAWLRTRRDYARLLNLIAVSAFLHQHQRPRRNGAPASRGQAILADAADYAAASAYAAAVLAETLSDLKKPLREAYERIRGLCDGGNGGISRREIREALDVPDSTVRRWLAELVELEYLEADVTKGGQGKSARYRLAESAPRQSVVLGLLTPEDLAARLGERP
jgi:DNA-binding transcriptional ArsR family regulator